MSSPASDDPSPKTAPGGSSDGARHLPPDARAAFERFRTTGDPAEIDPVLLAILADFVPHAPARPFAELSGDTRLIDDLGFDSLAITEVVFFTEDLFGIKISNEEILRVRTLDDLRGFIRGKLATAPGR